MATRPGRLRSTRRLRRDGESLWLSGLAGVAAVTVATLVLGLAGLLVAFVVSLLY